MLQTSSQPALVSFSAGRSCFCVRLDQVEEVLPAVVAARVPLAPPALLGVFNHRGSLLPLLDLGARLGLSCATATDFSMTLIVKESHVRIGLRVDEVGGLCAAAGLYREADPTDSPLWKQGLVTAAWRSAEQHLLMLDLERLLAPPPRSLAPDPYCP